MTRLLLAILLLCGSALAQLTSVTYGIGAIYRYNQGYPAKYILGDDYWPTWADDGLIYMPTSDTGGWQNAQEGSGGRNIIVGTLNGYSPAATGVLVNSMDAFGTEAQTGTDGLTYKPAGIISLSGVLYMWVYRQNDNPPYNATASQLIMSSDHGVTWTPLPPSTANPYTSPMFPTGFPNPIFLQYGQDGACPGIDSCSTYVYAYSTDCGDDCSNVILGRVLKSAIGNLSASDWSFYQGGGTWGALGTAVPVITLTDSNNPTGIQYVAGAGYVMLQWCWTGSCSGGSITPADTTWNIWNAQHPQGPWTLVQTSRWPTQGYYNPTIIPNSVSGHMATLCMIGDFQNQDPATGTYTLTLMPITLNFGSVTSVSGGSAKSGGKTKRQ
jgi:hypothetical protein